MFIEPVAKEFKLGQERNVDISPLRGLDDL
ncbi:MAG: hypothetical protein V7641_5143 [Blastocatellia bacterium]